MARQADLLPTKRLNPPELTVNGPGTPCNGKRAQSTQEGHKTRQAPFPAEMRGVLLLRPNCDTSLNGYAE